MAGFRETGPPSDGVDHTQSILKQAFVWVRQQVCHPRGVSESVGDGHQACCPYS